MTKFIKKPITIEATQWFKNGDHPEDGNTVFKKGKFKGELWEGKIVRYYRRPDMKGDGQDKCKKCNNIMHNHGWIDVMEDGHTVCPGDFIITGDKAYYYPCKPDIFKKTYDKEIKTQPFRQFESE